MHPFPNRPIGAAGLLLAACLLATSASAQTAGSEGLIDVLSSITYSGTSDLQRVIIAASLGLQS